MSAHDTHAHHAGHGDHHSPAVGPHSSLRDYAIGFVLSVILTAIPFWLVMAKVLPPEATKFVILGFAAVQVLVHMVYFLHLNAKVEHGWTMLSTVFTIIVVVIMLAGSIWVMYHMNTNMMPMDPHTMRNMP